MTRTTTFLMILVTTLFSFLAFRGINRQGMLYHDVGMNLLETKFLDEGFQLLIAKTNPAADSDFWEDIKTKTEGVPLHHGKPGFNLVLWLMSKILGFTDTLSAKVTAASGVFVLLLSFFAARELTGSLVSGLYSAAFLASSTFFLVYSRSGLADQVANFFFMGGFLLYLLLQKKSSRFLAFSAGLLLGYAFACNQLRAIYLPLLIIGLDGIKEFFKKTEKDDRFLSTVFLTLGFMAPLVVFQIPYSLAKIFWGPLPFRDYWTQLFERSRQITDLDWFQKPLELAQTYWRVERPIFSTAVIAGWIFLFLRGFGARSFKYFLLFTLSFLPFLVFSGMQYGGGTLPRIVSSSIPFACLGTGCAAGSAQKYLETRSHAFHAMRCVLTGCLLLMILSFKFTYNFKNGITKSGYSEASRFMAETGEKKFFILAEEPIWRFYLGRVAHKPYDRPPTVQALVEEAKRQDIKYVVADYATIHSKYGMAYTADFPRKYKSAARFSNPRGVSLPYLLDLFGSGSFEIAKDPNAQEIFIFEIAPIAQDLNLPPSS